MEARLELFGPRFWLEAAELLQAEWEESGRGEAVSLNPLKEVYSRQASLGHLVYVTLRDDGKLGGYFVGYLGAENTTGRKVLVMDALYVEPGLRARRGGVRLIKKVEEVARAQEVALLQMAHRAFPGDKPKNYEALGFRQAAIVYEKEL